MPSRPHSIYIEDELWREATERAAQTGSSAASIVNTALTAHFTINPAGTTSVQTGHEVSQMSHLSTAPTHRPLAEPLDHRVESGGPARATGATAASGSTPPVKPKTAQQQRDEILHGVASPPRKR